MQFLHCVRFDATVMGGDSTISDAFAGGVVCVFYSSFFWGTFLQCVTHATRWHSSYTMLLIYHRGTHFITLTPLLFAGSHSYTAPWTAVAAEELRHCCPEAFRVLATIPTTFCKIHYKRELPVHITYQRPIFVLLVSHHFDEAMCIYVYMYMYMYMYMYIYIYMYMYMYMLIYMCVCVCVSYYIIVLSCWSNVLLSSRPVLRSNLY